MELGGIPVIVWLLLPFLALIPAFIARSKGRSFGSWYMYGLLLWIVAMIHVLFVSSDQAGLDQQAMDGGDNRKCPYCAEIIRTEAKVCKHCGREVPAIQIQRYCRKCSFPLAADEEVCTNCKQDQRQPVVYAPSPAPKMTSTEKAFMAVVVALPILLLGAIYLVTSGAIGQPATHDPSQKPVVQTGISTGPFCSASKAHAGAGCVDDQGRWHWYTDEEVRSAAATKR